MVVHCPGRDSKGPHGEWLGLVPRVWSRASQVMAAQCPWSVPYNMRVLH